MNKIEKLIEELCPDGVQYSNLGNFIQLKKGKQLNKELLNENGKYPAFNGGVSYSGFTDTYNYEENTIIISQGGASAGFVNFVETKFYANAHCYVILPDLKKINNRFVYHFLKLNQENLTGKQHGAGIPALRTGEILNIQIPVPPLAIQEKIVEILDKFTQLETELETELEARKAQYQFYRNQLLAFENKKVEWKTLGEICFYPRKRISAIEVDLHNYVGVDNLLQDRQGKTFSTYVPTTGNLIEFIDNDILIGNIRPYLKKIWKSNCIGGTNGDVLVVRINEENSNIMNSDFLYHLLSSDEFFLFNMKFAKGAKMPRGDKDSILKFQIPVPPLSEQDRIVKILDQFDDLVNNISIGLPAEIKARRQQYEFYREKLLTFKELQTIN